MKQIEIYDTTLRDGAQMKGISYSVADKLKILQALDELGVSYVEGGWPGANPKDEDFFEEAKKLELKNTVLTAFGSTRKANTKVDEDIILKALLRAETDVICIVGKSSSKQVENTLNTSLENNLLMLRESVEYLKSRGKRVFVDAEHFFDGYVSDPQYSKKFIETAISGGSEIVVLCDTNGGSLPEDVFKVTEELVAQYGSQIKFGIHAHNDGDLAVANSIRAVRAGAIQVQGTVNGYGERCGNANLISIIANLQLKYKADKLICVPQNNLHKLTSVSKQVAEIANMNLSNYQPFVGASAFAHKGGLHASAMQRDKTSYEHIDPASVGNITKIIVSEQSGVSNILDWLKERDITLEANREKEIAQKILDHIKRLEHKGYSFENASASLELLVRKVINEHSGHKGLKYFELIEHNAHILNGEKTEASVRIKIGGKEIHTVSLGNGPANALDKALRLALQQYYPEIDNFQLKDFKVRILDSHLGTAAVTKVQISTGLTHRTPTLGFRRGICERGTGVDLIVNEDSERANNEASSQVSKSCWDTIGVNANIIKASWDAIVDSIEYGLLAQSIKPLVQIETEKM